MPELTRQNGSEFVVTTSKFFSDLGPDGQWWYAFFQLFFFSVMVSLSLAAYLRKKPSLAKGAGVRIDSDFLFAISIFLFVILSRFPMAIFGYQNPDECVWVACAKALLREPRLWLTADTATSGPLVVLPLILLKAFGLPIDLGSTKLASGITIGGAMVFTYLGCSVAFGKFVARIVILPLVVIVGMTSYWDFFVYNGEHMPVLLLSISFWLLARLYMQSISKFDYLWLGLVLGFVPFAKLQAIPLGLMVAALSFFLVLKRYDFKRAAYFALAGLTPAFIILSWTAIGGGLENFWNSYILYNFNYAGRENPESITVLDTLLYAWDRFFATPDVMFFFQACLTICFALLFIFKKENFLNWRNLVPLIFAILYFIVALYCIGKPHRDYPHYILFGFFATTILLGAMIHTVAQPEEDDTRADILKRTPLALVLIIISILGFYQRFSFHPEYNIYAERNKLGYTYMPEIVEVMYRNTAPGDKIALWGWSGTFYADTDLTMGTRFCDTSGIITPNPSQDYLLNTYIKDMERNKPKIFLDAISPNAFLFDNRDLYGIGNFPSLQEYITMNYDLTAEIEGYRVYVRR